MLNKKYLQDLIADNQVETVISLLKNDNTYEYYRNDILQQSARLSQLSRKKMNGSISNENANVEHSSIVASVLDLINDIFKDQSTTSTSQPIISQSTINKNMKEPQSKLVAFNEFMLDLHKQIKTENFSKMNCTAIIIELNEIFGQGSFDYLANEFNNKYVVGLSAKEQIEIYKNFMNSMLDQESTLRKAVKQMVDEQFDSVDVDQEVTKMFQKPSIEQWNVVAPLLSQLYSDRVFYTQEVADKFALLKSKIDLITDNALLFQFRFGQVKNDLKTFYVNNPKGKF